MFDQEGGGLPGQGLTGIEAPGDRYSLHPGPARGLEVADLVANIEDLARIEGKGAGNGTQAPGLAPEFPNAADEGELLAKVVGVEEGLDIFRQVGTEDAHVLRSIPQDRENLPDAFDEGQFADPFTETVQGGDEMEGHLAPGDAEVTQEAFGVEVAQFLHPFRIDHGIAVFPGEIIVDLQSLTEGIGQGAVEVEYEATIQRTAPFILTTISRTGPDWDRCLH